MRLGKLDNVLNIGPAQADNVHGTHDKDLLVFHETVSPDYPGWSDVTQTSEYLDNKDYGIHGIVDKEGHKAWAGGHGKAIFYHTISAGRLGTGYVNTRGIGIELVSRVMLDQPDNYHRWLAWWYHNKQIEEAAKLGAWITRTHDIPLQMSDGSRPGITTHYEVTTRFGVYGGHVDCWPRNQGGYFPKIRLVDRIRHYRELGY